LAELEARRGRKNWRRKNGNEIAKGRKKGKNELRREKLSMT
jgi:hypothetical protein